MAPIEFALISMPSIVEEFDSWVSQEPITVKLSERSTPSPIVPKNSIV